VALAAVCYSLLWSLNQYIVLRFLLAW